ncbi:MAG: hypothetical protein ACHQ9S_04110 [Candidatus Binatia bacterium]
MGVAEAQQAKELTAKIDEELAKRPPPKTVFEQMRKSALADLRAELIELADLLSTTRHRLVFIGKVGVGKTTAICHLLGLIADREKKKTNNAGVEKTVSVTEDLMATGSGFTTLCEVVVIPGDRNEFEIEPFPRLEVERIIGDFCLTTWSRVYPDNLSEGQKGSDQINFPPELVRAVRNMVKLPEAEKREDDAAIRLARAFPSNGFDQFQARVLGQANLDARTRTEFVCPSTEPNSRAWIKKTFDDLNLARLNTVSIPQRITLRVDAKLLTPQMANVAAVVDTKGVDAAQFNREDLDRYIREERTAVCILAEGFDTAPTDVAPLLQRHVTSEAPMSLSKFALMVIPRGSEPEKKVGGQGPVGDRDVGINLLRSQIEETLSSRGIRGLNVMFFDPLRHFEAVGVDYRQRSDSTREEVSTERDEVWNAIFDAIKLREDKAWERVTQVRDSFEKIRDGKGLNPEEENLVRQARVKISEHRHITLANADRFLELYRRLWEGPGGRHVMTLRAANNRFGYYSPRKIDVYYDAIPIAEQLVRTAVSRPKEDVLAIVRSVKDTVSSDSDLRELLTVLETRIDSSFEAMVREVGATMQTYLHDMALAPQDMSNQFWVSVQRRYGQGSGYRDDVLTMYADKMEGHEVFLADAAEKAWQRIVIDPVLEYLAEE